MTVVQLHSEDEQHAREFSIWELIRDELAFTPNLDEAAAAIAEAVPEDQLRATIRLLVRRVVPSEAGKKRRHDVEEDARAAVAQGPSRVEGLRRRGGASDIPSWWVNVAGGKALGDCTLPEIREVAQGYRKRAVDMASWSQRFTALEKLMEKSKTSTVGELSVEKLAEIFYA